MEGTRCSSEDRSSRRGSWDWRSRSGSTLFCVEYLFLRGVNRFEGSSFLGSIKSRSQTAQVRAAVAVNQELVLLNWGIGSEIIRRQKAEGWGTKVIENLGRDLKRSFPEMRGLFPRNLKYMKAFAAAWRGGIMCGF